MESNSLHTDKTLFALVAAGDSSAYRILFERYYDRLRFNAMKFLKSTYWAEEIVQEVFLWVWDNRNTLVEIDHPGAWLYRIVSNKCFDRSRKQELEIRVLYAIQVAAEKQPTTEQQHAYDLKVLQQLIAAAVANLSPQQRLIYTLKEKEGLSYKEIGAQLGISPHTVHNHLNRAYQAVRNYLLEHGDYLVLLCYLISLI